MVLLFQGKVDVIEEHDACVRTVRFTYKLPSVLKLRNFVRTFAQSYIRFSRENIYIRDGHKCQYCGEKFNPKSLTLDHVVPVVQGGEKTWENIVTACVPCNQKKGGRTPHQAAMKLLKKPTTPQWLPTVQVRFSFAEAPASWRSYLVLRPRFV